MRRRFAVLRAKRDSDEDDFEASDVDSDEGVDNGMFSLSPLRFYWVG